MLFLKEFEVSVNGTTIYFIVLTNVLTNSLLFMLPRNLSL